MALGDDTLVNANSPIDPVTPRRNRAMSMDDHLSGNRWRPFAPMDATPKAATQGYVPNGESIVEPLSIRKKVSNPFNPPPASSLAHRSGDESPTRRQGSSALPRTTPQHKLLPQISTVTTGIASTSTSISTPTQSARASVVEPVRKLKLPMSSNHAAKLQEAELLAELALTTREDVSNMLLLLCLRC